MDHLRTIIILLFFEKSKPKVGRAIEFINELSNQKNVICRQKLELILQRIEQVEMNEFTFIKFPPQQSFNQVDYDRRLFDFMDFNHYEIETRTKPADTAYLHGSIIFKKKQSENLFINLNNAA